MCADKVGFFDDYILASIVFLLRQAQYISSEARQSNNGRIYISIHKHKTAAIQKCHHVYPVALTTLRLYGHTQGHL